MKHNMKKKIRIKNWAEDLNRSLQRRYTDGQEAHEKMFSITSYERNANQNYNEVSLHTGQNGHYLKKKKKKLQSMVEGFPGGSVVKNLSAMQETRVPSLVGKIPWRRTWQPTPVILPGLFHGQRSP